jgi:hypothetical protein
MIDAMHWISEDPVWMIALGIVVEAILAVVLIKTGRGVVVALMAAVALLIGLGLLTERLLVTPREEVEQTLDGVAAALVANSLPRVLGYIAPQATELRALAEENMPHLHFTEAKVRELQVTINSRRVPPTAEANFLGVITVKDSSGRFPREHYLERFTVMLRRDAQGWLITGYRQQTSQNALPWRQPGQ